MNIIIGSARCDENKKYRNGTRGDQRQTVVPDYNGEVSLQNFYVHKKGWVILRPNNGNYAKVIAALMHNACNNQFIGYSQNDRYDILKKGVNTLQPTNCDCSSLIRAIIKEATGKDPGDFHTGNEAAKLMSTGLFTKITYYSNTPLYEGDVLVTKTKGHTVIVVFGNSRELG